ncbi:transporter substrate-binding domain-containing protein [Neobacillus soli]|uniref:transporter substrate-binding domain-containing protein n=1 Tax=Neobacillus soli TaxID=220688 RepID=UPI000A968D66|nr:transporter substrate-binding domain-containing protein [Neobacillus soli]
MRYLGLLIVFLTFLLFPQLAEAQDTHVIRVGFDQSLPPLSYLDQKEEAAGFDIELIRKVAEHQGYQLQFIPLELEDAIQMLKEGQLDVIVGLKYTSTRNSFFDFSDSYLTMSDAVVIPSNSRDFSGMNDLKEKVAAVQREDSVITQLESIRGSEVLEAFNQPDALDMLFLGRADVFLGNRWTAEYVLQNADKQKHYRIRTGLIPPSDYAFAVRKGNYKLVNVLNKGLVETHHNGTYEHLYSQYLEPYSGLAIGWWRKLVYGLLIVMGIIFTILIGSFIWNKRLHKEVNRQTEALLAQEKMRALGQLVAGIAHELRNPLTAIKTFVELLPRKMDDPRFRAELVRHVPEEVERMNRIIEDLLDYSREKPMHRKWGNLLELVQSVTDLFMKQIRSEGIELEIDIPPSLEVFMDRGRIKQVLINLVLNAIEAMAHTKEKRLTFHVSTEGPMQILAIADSGKGIAKEDALHLFQPFYTTKNQGIGLGLYISQKIMKEHGGRIEVKSTKNTGTTFSLFFANEGDASR